MRFTKSFSPFTGTFTCINFSQVVHVKMLILKYFKPLQKVERKDVILPNPHGPLSSEMPPKAIEAVNQRVSET